MNQSIQRQQALTPLSRTKPWDMLIIGGGITGAGIAREAARRGLEVLLIEQKDFAWGTSSRSSKMVHGGLRYIASGDYKTTMYSVRERERMLKEASGLVNEMHYVMPHYKGKFPPPWMFNTLLRVYDKLAGQHYFTYFKKQAFLPINPGIKEEKLLGASQFSDAVTDDSRLVMRVLDEAIHDGAHAINYLKAESLLTDEQGLVIGATLRDTTSDSIDNKGAQAGETSVATSEAHSSYKVYAKVVVSATGAWADNLRKQAINNPQLSFKPQIRPSRGSHLVLSQERLPIHQAFTLLHPRDKRALFVFPWENRTVLGTTDLDHPPLDDQEVGITNDEVDYLLEAVNYLFDVPEIGRDDVISSWAGVRPLISDSGDGKRVDPSKEKREHSVWLDNNLITVSGGKLTTFRLIALDVLKQTQKLLPIDHHPSDDDSVFSNPVPTNDKFDTLPTPLQVRLQGFYGRKLDTLLSLAETQDFEPIAESNTVWAEVRYATHYEQVIHLDDLLLRRTRLGLILPNGAIIDAVSDRIKHICQQELGWDDKQWQQELQRYQQLWQRYYHLPTAA